MVLFEWTRRMLWLGYTDQNPSSIHMSLPYFDATNTLQYWDINPSFSGTGQTLVSGEWNNFTLTYNNSTRVAIGYINSIQGATATRPSTGDLLLPADAGLPAIRIFGRDSDTTYFHNLKYVTCYNRALTAAEIQQNFNALRGRFGK